MVVVPTSFPTLGGGGGGGGTDDQVATEVPYNNIASGIVGSNCQAAIDELASSAYIQDITVPGSYLVLAPDDLILVNSPGAIATITLPAVPEEHKEYKIKDKSGNASSFNITVVGNGNLIDGLATYTIRADFQSIDLVYDGADWNLI